MVMLSQRFIESLVGLFIITALIALSVLAFKVSGLTSLFPEEVYTVTADFDDIGGLKVRSPVKIGGVQVGEVSRIALNPVTFKAQVTMRIRDKFDEIPDDSSAGIFTAGLLGDNYIAITPMYSQNMLKNGGRIEMTRSAMVLEKLIGQFIYKMGNGSNNAASSAGTATSPNNT
jgi:phospholipid/cholesterol/gamma-HCH transport system substrate-binding protein